MFDLARLLALTPAERTRLLATGAMQILPPPPHGNAGPGKRRPCTPERRAAIAATMRRIHSERRHGRAA